MTDRQVDINTTDVNPYVLREQPELYIAFGTAYAMGHQAGDLILAELSLSLMVKLASLVVHVQEGTSDTGYMFDTTAMQSLAGDAEVQAWLDGIDPALLPVKR